MTIRAAQALLLSACIAGLASAAAPASAPVQSAQIVRAVKAVTAGDLIWAGSYCPSPDCDTAAYLPYLATSTSPLLVVEAKGISGDTLFRVAGSRGIRGWVGRKEVLRTEPSLLSGRLKGEAEAGLILSRSDTRSDTQGNLRLDPRGGAGDGSMETTDLSYLPPLRSSAQSKPQAFPDDMRQSDIRGLAEPPFLDPDTAAFATLGYWHVTDDSRRPAAWRKEKIAGDGLAALYREDGKSVRAPVFAALRSGLLAFSWKPGKPFLVRLVSATADTSAPKQEDILHLGDVQAADLNGDGHPEWVVEIRRTYGDGAYRQLAVFSMGKTLHHLVVALDGQGGEPGTPTVEGAWWIGPGSGKEAGRRIYIASTEVPGGMDEGEDGKEGKKETRAAPLEVLAIEAGSEGRLRESRTATYQGVFQGGPLPKAAAERAAYQLRKHMPTPATIPLQVLPWRVGKDILWRPGQILPGPATPKGLAFRPDSAQVVILPRRD